MTEHSSGFCDHDSLFLNLKEINKEPLVPKRQHVLRLVKAFRMEV